MEDGLAREIAIYGKGEVGKTATVSNLSAALCLAGHKVMQVGCDPKADSTGTLRGGKTVPTVLGTLRENPMAKPDDMIVEGFAGVYCVETGGPSPGVIWPGKGIVESVRFLKTSGVYEELQLDFVIYDVLGDDAGGNFTVPVREGIAGCIYAVLSADFAAIYTANTLFKAIRKAAKSGGPLAGGLIANFIDAPHARDLVDDFAEQTTIGLAGCIPRSAAVTQAGLERKTVIEAYPGSTQAVVYIRLAETLAAHEGSRVPYPLEGKELWRWTTSWNTRILARETGEGVGASI